MKRSRWRSSSRSRKSIANASSRSLKSVRELLEEGTHALESAGVSFGHGTTNALDEAAWLLLHTMGLPYGALHAHLDDKASASRAAAFRALVRKRISSRKPAAYLLKE